MPNTADEWLEQALRYHLEGNLGQAEELYRQVLQANPAQADASSNLGVVLQATGRAEEALACFERAVQLNPHQADAHNNLGNALKDQGSLAPAIECFHQALQINPGHANAYCNLGNAYADQGHLPEAIECFRRALQFNPRYTNAAFNLANALRDLGQLDEAIACYQHTLTLDPKFTKAHNNLGNALRDRWRLTEATLCYRQALQVDSGHVNAQINLAEVLKDQGFFDEAFAQYELILQANPGHVLARFHRSLVRLLLGDFARGWPDYELRFAQADSGQRSLPQPRWDGAPLEGKTILIHGEQGLGDNLHFIRYAPLVKERGGRVLFESPPELFRLFQSVEGIDAVLPAGQALPPFDYYVPLVSLPGIFGTVEATIPARVPYLHADPGMAEAWRKELESLPGFKIGIVWQGNPLFRVDKFRSFPLRHFESLARMEGIHLISLQKGPGATQLPAFAEKFPILDLNSRLKTFSDTAAVMKNLDLVITSDTSVCHVAGALGVPVWTVLWNIPDWRWLMDRPDTPWYPTMRLFRQKKFGDWGEVFERITSEIRNSNIKE